MPRPQPGLSAEDIVRFLDLRPHPEGGFFRETYRSAERVPRQALPERFTGDRSFSTAILYLLTAGTFSHLHRLAADEVWHLYAGGPLHLGLLHADGRTEEIILGGELSRGEKPQAAVPAGCWFGAWPADGAPYALAGCTVSPGFDYLDFEMGRRSDLLARYPQARRLIEKLAAD